MSGPSGFGGPLAGSRARRYLARLGPDTVDKVIGEHTAACEARIFVSADTTALKLTFSAAIPSNAFRTLKAIRPGGWIKVTTPFDQPRETAVVAAGEPSTGPRQAVAEPVSKLKSEGDQR